MSITIRSIVNGREVTVSGLNLSEVVQTALDAELQMNGAVNIAEQSATVKADAPTPMQSTSEPACPDHGLECRRQSKQHQNGYFCSKKINAKDYCKWEWRA